jgi:hypothetical protein
LEKEQRLLANEREYSLVTACHGLILPASHDLSRIVTYSLAVSGVESVTAELTKEVQPLRLMPMQVAQLHEQMEGMQRQVRLPGVPGSWRRQGRVYWQLLKWVFPSTDPSSVDCAIDERAG